MNDSNLDEALAELESAEDFLDYFEVAYDPALVQVNRLHILQRFHDYLTEAGPRHEPERRERYTQLLTRAYHDFVASDARTEKVFRVFHLHEPRSVAVPLADLALPSR